MSVPKLRFKGFEGDWTSSDFSKASVQIIDGDRGFNYPKSDDFYDDEFCLFLNAGNVTKQGFNFENTQFITKNKDSSLRKGKLERNDLVITTRGTVGNVAYFNDSVSFNNMRINSGMVIARCQKNVLADFINQFLKSDLFEKWLDKNAFGSAQPQLTVKLLNSISLNYPSKPEQTKIASFLSAVDEKISQLTQKHELLSQYKQGMMQKLFSQQIRFKADDGSEFGEWEETTLGNLYQIGSSKRVLQEDWKSEGIPFLRTREIISLIEKTKFSSPIFITEELYVNLITKYGSIKENDILVSGVGTVGKAYVVKATDKFYFKDGNVIWLSHKGLNNSKFIYYFFQSPIMENYFIANKSVTTVDTFTIEQAKKVVLFNPCLEEQTKIANFLSNIDQKIEVVAQQIEQAKQWKKGLLQQMFV